jgi:hypothetical protein
MLVRFPRRSGGIGRRAWFRSMYPQGCGGSSPFFGTSIYPKITVSGTPNCSRLLVLKQIGEKFPSRERGLFACGLRRAKGRTQGTLRSDSRWISLGFFIFSLSPRDGQSGREIDPAVTRLGLDILQLGLVLGEANVGVATGARGTPARTGHSAGLVGRSVLSRQAIISLLSLSFPKVARTS